ncbi:hypothetical protein LCGC14_2714060 [marine sediment metagenome]|uniref:Uncharacterized protein n=1 Tax=marine sediment metagenome TaxID=412755 RepID=A0A0F8ZZP1_9ZZZZ
MKDYRAATWAVVATTIMVLAAASVIPATAAILGLAAGCSGIAFLHALMSPRTETIEIQLGAVSIAQMGPPSVKEQLFKAAFGGVYGDRSPGNASAGGGCPVHGPACSNC